MIGLDGDLLFEQAAGFGAPVEAPFETAALIRQPAVHLTRAHRQQFGFHLRAEPRDVLACPGQPLRQQRLEAHRPGVARRLPNPYQHTNARGRIRRAPSPGRAVRRRTVRRFTQQGNRVLAVVVCQTTEFVQQRRTARPIRLGITLPIRVQCIQNPFS